MRPRFGFALIVVVAAAAALTLIFARSSDTRSSTPSSASHSLRSEGTSGVVEETIAELGARATGNSCHFEYHTAGQRLGDAGVSLQEVAAVEGFDGCNWGLVHGAVEGALANTTPGTFARQAAQLCAVTDSGLRSNCEHGAGHVAYSAAAGDVLAALRLCDTQSESRDSCADGVMMAFANAVDNSVLAQKQAWGLCKQLTGIYQDKCELYSGFLWWQYAQGDVQALLVNCRARSANCGTGVGRAVAMHTESAAEAVRQCARASDLQVRTGCAFGVGEQLALLRRTGQSEGAVQEVCTNVPRELDAACRRGAGL